MCYASLLKGNVIALTTSNRKLQNFLLSLCLVQGGRTLPVTYSAN